MRNAPGQWPIALLSGAAGFASLASAIVFRDELPFAKSIARPIGFVTVFSGMALFFWAAVHLKSAIGGLVAPRLAELVTTGPFRLVRHPTYVAMLGALVGASIATRSAVGLAVTLLVFLPVEIHRARLEERALGEMFGENWKEYASVTGFFVPRIRAVPRKKKGSDEQSRVS